MTFDYSPKLGPSTSARRYAESLMRYAPQDIISGPILLGEINEPLIKKYLDLLTLDNLNI